MGLIRRGGYIFISWIGDHPPRHVHVYRKERLILKFDLVNRRVMVGRANRKIMTLLKELESEGRL